MISIEKLAFNLEEIRDTEIHWSTIIDSRGFTLKTIIIENHLNQIVTLECWASRHEDFSNSFLVGASWDAGIDTDSFQTCSSYFPFLRLKASCGVTPTEGDLTTALEIIGDK